MQSEISLVLKGVPAGCVCFLLRHLGKQKKFQSVRASLMTPCEDVPNLLQYSHQIKHMLVSQFIMTSFFLSTCLWILHRISFFSSCSTTRSPRCQLKTQPRSAFTARWSHNHCQGLRDPLLRFLQRWTALLFGPERKLMRSAGQCF